MSLIQYQIDAFTREAFCGNPAAVILTPQPLSVDLMQSLAMENNLSETAFLVPNKTAPGHYDIRWFTPTVEIAFCGHASIASAHFLFTLNEAPLSPDGKVHFRGHMIGDLSITREDTPAGPEYHLKAPKFTPRPTPVTPAIRDAFDAPITEAFHAGENLFVVLETAQAVKALKPDFKKLIPLSDHGVGVTAAAAPDYDFVSRFFVPAEGIDEDPVTGSAHASLGPYWAQRLGKATLKARQVSARGGDVQVQVLEQATIISGGAVTIMRSEIFL